MDSLDGHAGRSSGRSDGGLGVPGGGDHPPLQELVHSCPSVPGRFHPRKLDGERILDHPRPAAPAGSFRGPRGFRPGHGGVRSSGPSAEPPGGSLCPGDLQRGGCGRGAGDPLWLGIDFPGGLRGPGIRLWGGPDYPVPGLFHRPRGGPGAHEYHAAGRSHRELLFLGGHHVFDLRHQRRADLYT